MDILSIQTGGIGGKATIAASYTLSADAGSFVSTGTAAALMAGRTVAADSGAISWTGSAAGLVYGSLQPRINAEAGTFTLSGQPAALTMTRKVAADPGSYVWAGSPADLTIGVAVLDTIPVVTLRARRRMAVALATMEHAGITAKAARIMDMPTVSIDHIQAPTEGHRRMLVGFTARAI